MAGDLGQACALCLALGVRCRPIHALRFLLAACWTRPLKKASALAELETIRHFHTATKDEKKDAQKQEETLAASSDCCSGHVRPLDAHCRGDGNAYGQQRENGRHALPR
jgi:hypothetical protein